MMITFIGEHSTKIDAKGRVSFPSQLKRQLETTDDTVRFVLKKSNYKECLELHPLESWQAMMLQLTKKLNPVFNKKHNAFLTQFSKGTSEVALDSIGRLLVPKSLCEYAAIEKDVVFLGVANIIEVWSKESFEAATNTLPTEDFEQLADDIFGDNFNLYD